MADGRRVRRSPQNVMTLRRALALAVMALSDVVERYEGEGPADWLLAIDVIRDLHEQERRRPSGTREAA